MIRIITEYPFMMNAVIASLLASVMCGIVGVIIVEKKLVMMSGGVAHTAYGGVGLGYLLGFEPIIGAALFSVGAAFGIGAMKRRGGANTDIIISLFWALGMALGIAFIALMPGYPPDINSYLFGNILTVTRSDIFIMIPASATVLLITVVFYNDIKAYLFDENFCAIMGMRVRILEYTVLIMIALSVVILLRVAGIILVIALLTAPSACASMISHNLKNRMIISALFSSLFCISGLFISYQLSVPSGATIIFVSVLTYAAILTATKIRDAKTAE
ncbi:MAG: metal ABC transporter permease [Eubacteriales bacterium]|nr:metal ABC transporter permease [Eubacteriales bacterium]